MWMSDTTWALKNEIEASLEPTKELLEFMKQDAVSLLLEKAEAVAEGETDLDTVLDMGEVLNDAEGVIAVTMTHHDLMVDIMRKSCEFEEAKQFEFADHEAAARALVNEAMEDFREAWAERHWKIAEAA